MFGDDIKQQDSNALSFQWLEVFVIRCVILGGKSPSLNLNMFDLGNMKKKIHVGGMLFIS
jgi:hypothetical protein